MALLSLCRAVVFPSSNRSEAFGITLVEGAMAGKPLISTELDTGTCYVNKAGETGIVIPPENVFALRAAMDRISGDVKLSEAMGRAARQRYESLFMGPRMGNDYAALYRSLF